ncbi:MAG TPA: hypothetical protein DEB06_05735, partial [Phycisphaerales bacterium]|nr:hypothetical protein [Phycisphaerales bacterium]
SPGSPGSTGSPGSPATARDTFYALDAQAAGVDFASMLHDLTASGIELSDAASFQPASRGLLDAAASVEGFIGRPDTRRGRGRLRVAGAEVLSLPGVLPLLRLSNLQLPLGERVEFASAAFFLRGPRVEFEALEAESPSVIIAGQGTITFPSAALDLRFSTRGRDTIPILSDIFKGLRDEFVTSVVRGTLANPEYSLEQWQATRRMLGTIFNTAPRKTPAGVVASPAEQAQP